MNETLKNLLPMLRRFAYSLTGSKADADDVVQITIEKLLVKGIPDDVEPAKWAFKICRNVWIDEYRSRKVRQNTAQADILPELITNDEHNVLEMMQMMQKVNVALGQLPDEQRAIVSLVALQGMAYKEVAHTLDIPIGSVMSKLSRARSTLYNLIKPDFNKEQV
ncbi:RNA polymerase sigma factor [Pseudoalteromonas sp. SWXJZ94C]|uniref:RNA polymerase sigma factor n=1 Tax=unclassified Pseudoalteromonas TaxID=194690 RepID=UPI00140B960F|nr:MULTISPECIES: RNA polymerase sigma factor [unclassified Pseudoalteromonas]MBH0055597.1 RNA polymerase sigma factor [Pseudoalteromonas sp. SWXJZ94C]